MKNKAVCFCNLALGLLYIATTVWGYSIAFPMKEYIHLAEWCCISGLLGGTFYLFAFIYEFVTKKRLNAILSEHCGRFVAYTYSNDNYAVKC